MILYLLILLFETNSLMFFPSESIVQSGLTAPEKSITSSPWKLISSFSDCAFRLRNSVTARVTGIVQNKEFYWHPPDGKAEYKPPDAILRRLNLFMTTLSLTAQSQLMPLTLLLMTWAIRLAAVPGLQLRMVKQASDASALFPGTIWLPVTSVMHQMPALRVWYWSRDADGPGKIQYPGNHPFKRKGTPARASACLMVFPTLRRDNAMNFID